MRGIEGTQLIDYLASSLALWLPQVEGTRDQAHSPLLMKTEECINLTYSKSA